MTELVRLAAVADIPEGTGREFTVGDRVVALFHTAEGWYAIDGICSHAGGPLAQGRVEAGVVTCPWHGWQYRLESGHHCLNHRIQQTSFAVEIMDGDVYVRTAE